MTTRPIGLIGAAAAILFAAGAAQAQDIPKNDYAKPDTWLCGPGKAGDACAVDLTTTVVKADGSTTTEAFKADPKAPIDCFYVYPTVSLDPTPMSDMIAGPEEKNVVKAQLARFGSKCRIYAPMYRQFTLTALRANMSGAARAPGAAAAPRANTGYLDVVDAWDHYLAHENKGRGVVLIGHSQGSGVLTQLIRNEIDGKPVQAKIVSALLMGTTLGVEKGKGTGTFKSMPLCRSASQTGCVIAYASFRDRIPPPADSLFGRVRPPNTEGYVAACVNPAALGGGKGALHTYFSNAQTGPQWVNGKPNPATPFVSTPGLVSGECVDKNGFSYLEVHVNADPADPRTDDIGGDVMANGKPNAGWGLHLVDANLAMGNLVDIVGAESKAYLAKRK